MAVGPGEAVVETLKSVAMSNCPVYTESGLSANGIFSI